jgi:hypothetical protein
MHLQKIKDKSIAMEILNKFSLPNDKWKKLGFEAKSNTQQTSAAKMMSHPNTKIDTLIQVIKDSGKVD